MSFSIKKLFSNLFLSVVIEGNECIFYGQVFRNDKLIKTTNAKFTDISIDSVDEKVLKYILTKTIKHIRGIARRSLAINLSNMLGFFTI